MQDDLGRKARRFAKELAALLNTTVADGITLSSLEPLRGDGATYVIGHRLSPRNPHKPGLIPLTISRKPATLFLHLLHIVQLDEGNNQSLTDWKVEYVVQFGRSADTGTLFAYDYARKPDNQYPHAHFHIYGGLGRHFEGALEGNERSKLRDLHFPVGGFTEEDGRVRYRPILEDIIEMLILEEMVTPKEGWEASIQMGRERFYELQYEAIQARREAQAASEN